VSDLEAGAICFSEVVWLSPTEHSIHRQWLRSVLSDFVSNNGFQKNSVADEPPALARSSIGASIRLQFFSSQTT
jgi:hypothetical protein